MFLLGNRATTIIRKIFMGIKRYMKVIEGVVVTKQSTNSKTGLVGIPNFYLISKEQYSQNIIGATVKALPTYNEDGTVLTDADLTLLEDS